MLLGPDDSLPRTPSRLLVAGATGAGKTTLARRLAGILDLQHTELDALHHGPGWQPRPEFLQDVRQLAKDERWVTEWQYDDARPILLERADLLVWLDLPRHLVMRQVTARTVSRRLRRTELWNGNRETGLWRMAIDPEHVIRWAWRTHPTVTERVRQVLAERPALPVVRLKTRQEIEQWVSGACRRGRPH